MAETELLLGVLEEGLELGVGEEGDGHDVPASVLADIDREVALGDVEWEPVLVVPEAPLSQAGAPLEDLLEDCRVWQLGVFPLSHLG